MGIEQILLPILGGIAQGAGKGIEEKARLRREAEAARDRQTAKYGWENPEFYETPEGRDFGIRFYGKEEFRGMRSALNLQTAQRKWRERQNEMGIINPAEMPADFAPTLAPLPESPQMNPGGIAGLISKFLPGAGSVMNAFGGGQGGSPAQGTQMAQGAGPASGPQGYNIPQPTSGWQPAQTPNMQPQVTPQAAPAVVPVGAPAGSDQSILKAAFDRGLDARLVSQVRTTPSGTRVIQTGGGGPLTKEEREAKYPRVTRLSDNMTLNIGKNGLKTFSYKNPDKNLNTPFDMAEHILQLANRGNRNIPEQLMEIMKLKSDIELTEEADKIKNRTRVTAFAEAEPDVITAKRELAIALAAAQEAVKLTSEGSPLGLKVKSDVAQAGKQGEILGQFLGENTPIKLADGRQTTVRELEIDTHRRNAEAAAAGQPLSEGATKMMGTNEDLVNAVNEIGRLYKPEYVGRIYGNGWYKEMEDMAGRFSPEQAQFWQAISMARNARIMQLTGAGVTHEDAVRIADEMFDPTKSATSFVAKLQGFDRFAKERMVRDRELIGRPRDESLGFRKTTPPVVAAPPASVALPAPTGTAGTPTQPPGRTAPVAPHDASATSAPVEPVGKWLVGGGGKEVILNESSFGPDGKLIPQVAKELAELRKNNQLAPGTKFRRVPDDQFLGEMQKMEQQ